MRLDRLLSTKTSLSLKYLQIAVISIYFAISCYSATPSTLAPVYTLYDNDSVPITKVDIS